MADFTGIDLFGEIYDADDANAVQQSQVVATVDATSDDDHVPTAKAVFDAITSAPSDFYHNMTVAFPENTTAITITPDSIELTADESVTITSDKPYTRVTFTDWANLSGADITNFTYIGQPADFSSIADMVIEFLPDKTVLGLKCLIETSGGDNHYAYYFYRVLERETAEAYAGMDNLLFAPEWDMLSLYPTINASNELEGLVINGGSYTVKDPNAADQTLSNLTSASDARDNLGLGTAATINTVSTYSAGDAGSTIPTVQSVRRSHQYKSEQFLTGASTSVTGTSLYRQVFEESLNVASGVGAYLSADVSYITDIVDISAIGQASTGVWYPLKAYVNASNEITVENLTAFSNPTVIKVRVIIVYSKS